MGVQERARLAFDLDLVVIEEEENEVEKDEKDSKDCTLGDDSGNDEVVGKLQEEGDDDNMSRESPCCESSTRGRDHGSFIPNVGSEEVAGGKEAAERRESKDREDVGELNKAEGKEGNGNPEAGFIFQEDGIVEAAEDSKNSSEDGEEAVEAELNSDINAASCGEDIDDKGEAVAGLLLYRSVVADGSEVEEVDIVVTAQGSGKGSCCGIEYIEDSKGGGFEGVEEHNG